MASEETTIPQTFNSKRKAPEDEFPIADRRNTRSTRATRKAAVTMSCDGCSDDELSSTMDKSIPQLDGNSGGYGDFGPSILQKAPLFRAPTSRRPRSKYDNTEEMLTNPNTPLAKTKLRELLCNPKAWELLNETERGAILSRFPVGDDILDAGTAVARPDVGALKNNNHFRHDVARYQESITLGRHEPDFISEAVTAHQMREEGCFDEFDAGRFERVWEMAYPSKALAAEEDGERKEGEA